jgi:hypothetical protein
MWKMRTMTMGKKRNKTVRKIEYAQCLSFYGSVTKPNIFLFDVNIECSEHALR